MTKSNYSTSITVGRQNARAEQRGQKADRAAKIKGLVEGDDRAMLIGTTENNNGFPIKTFHHPSFTYLPGCTCSFWSGTCFLTTLLVLLYQSSELLILLESLSLCVSLSLFLTHSLHLQPDSPADNLSDNANRLKEYHLH